MLNKQGQDKLIKNIEGVETGVKKKYPKIKRIFYSGVILTAAITAIVYGLKFNEWSAKHKIVVQWPVVFRSPVMIVTRPTTVVNLPAKPLIRPVLAKEAGASATLSEKDIILSKVHGVTLWKIYMLESTRGKNDGCRNSGNGFGGFGVKDDKQKVVCYPDFKTAVDRAEYWLIQDGVDRNTVKALCVWSNHLAEYEKTGTCSYYESYISL